jgi:hypothetical protein
MRDVAGFHIGITHVFVQVALRLIKDNLFEYAQSDGRRGSRI